MNSIIALIPARSGSKRIPSKNIKRLGDHPLIAYTIAAAKQSGIFEDIYVSSDSPAINDIADYYGAKTVYRSWKSAQDTSPDIEWIKDAFNCILLTEDTIAPYFMILRPTNPFRTPEMIWKAWRGYRKGWLKAVEPIKQHPDKMWDILSEHEMASLTGTKAHVNQSNTLPVFWVQNGSLEIRPTEGIEYIPMIVQPYLTQGYEGYDINDEKDWVYAEWLIKEKKAVLPTVEELPYGLTL